jgi:hypothetical protein
MTKAFEVLRPNDQGSKRSLMITSISLLSLRGCGLSNREEPSRFKLENTTIVHRIYIGGEMSTDQAVSSSTGQGK